MRRKRHLRNNWKSCKWHFEYRHFAIQKPSFHRLISFILGDEMGWICRWDGKDRDSMCCNDSHEAAFFDDFPWSVDELKRYLLNRNSNEKRLRINKIFIIFLFIRKFVFSASISLFQATRSMFRIAVLFLLLYFVFYSLLLQPLLSAYPYVHKPVFVSWWFDNDRRRT